MKAFLILEDGTVFKGTSIGSVSYTHLRYIKSLMRILLTRRIRYLMTAGRCAN